MLPALAPAFKVALVAGQLTQTLNQAAKPVTEGFREALNAALEAGQDDGAASNAPAVALPARSAPSSGAGALLASGGLAGGLAGALRARRRALKPQNTKPELPEKGSFVRFFAPDRDGRPEPTSQWGLVVGRRQVTDRRGKPQTLLEVAGERGGPTREIPWNRVWIDTTDGQASVRSLKSHATAVARAGGNPRESLGGFLGGLSERLDGERRERTGRTARER